VELAIWDVIRRRPPNLSTGGSGNPIVVVHGPDRGTWQERMPRDPGRVSAPRHTLRSCTSTPYARPDVEVLVDGICYPGEARGYWDADGQPVVNVHSRAVANETHLETFPATQVRSV
jgi:hypothetical protein